MAGFILSRHWHDTSTGIELEYWLHTAQGPVCVRVPEQESVFFIAQENVAQLPPLLGLQRGWRVQNLSLASPTNQPIAGVYCTSYRRAREISTILRRAMPVWEADVRPPERFLMERFIKSSVSVVGGQWHSDGTQVPQVTAPGLRPGDNSLPNFTVVSLDIETDMRAAQLFSIAVWGSEARHVFMVDETCGGQRSLEGFTLHNCASETACLEAFFNWLHDYDPDILIGWSVVGFDLWVLDRICRRLGVNYALGRDGRRPTWRQDINDRDKRYITIPGRVALDGIELLRMAFYHFESFSLEFVARALLGDGKLLKGSGRGEEITRLYQDDKLQLARYNLKDCELVWEIFIATQLIAFASAKSQMTGLPLDKIGGSAAAFEFSYLPRLHRLGYVAPSIGDCAIDFASPGGYVLESQPGLFKQVLVFDFKSLYPSIIRTFNIDPGAFWVAEHKQLPAEQVVAGFHDAAFARDCAILPNLITELWQQRDDAKRSGDQPLSQAIKIIMNSFYGVLGSNLCRFYDPRVASSITLRGHEILQTTQQWFDEQGFTVIYGDTDSVFVWLGDDFDPHQCATVGQSLARKLNDFWQQRLAQQYQVPSYLEIQFETHFSRFFMPKIRGQETGSKKRYAGLVQRGEQSEVLIRGLEAVRSDWTALARQFQREVFGRVFYNQPVEQYVLDITAQLHAGKLDDLLVYRKRLRRPLEDYEAISPPHVQAARALQANGDDIRRGDWVEYVITLQGARPKSLSSGLLLDYAHYQEKQLAPVVDGLLATLGTNYQQLVDRQYGLF
ncbi:DNA polymerase II [Halioxenophilus aromaticivorans]|uniref:DNA polymerase n=1 Tax=Halioxenophilus aromaticivorans TaxID=1306992 RepID=A0AAV3U1F4_9ALTE